MFSGLRQNSTIYILEKTEVPSLKIGQVMSVSNPKPKYGTTAPLYGNPEQEVDISVKVGDTSMEFKRLPAHLSIANDGNMVVSESREAMYNEVDGMKRTSQSVLDSIPYHEGVVNACDAMSEVLNPAIAKERQTEQRIGAMEEKMGGMESTLLNIQDMLASALSKNKSK